MKAPFNGQEKQTSRRRFLRWGIRAIVALACVGIVYWATLRLAAAGPERELNQVALPLLAVFVIVLSVVLAGILLRNLVKLIVERKRGIIGSRLRSKLVFSFLALVLAPSLILFSGSAQLIKKTVEGLLRTPVEEMTRESEDIADAWKRSERMRLQETLRYAIDQGQMDQEALAQHELDWLAQMRNGRLLRWLSRYESTDPGETVVRLRSWIPELQTPGLYSRLERAEERLQFEAAYNLNGDVWLAGRAINDFTANSLERIAESKTAFRQFRVQRRDFLHFYLYLIALIFLVTVFAATWLGFYLARRITGPIREMAAASREISAGNLDVRIQAQAGDEIGLLVEAFNEMTAELQENREVITRGNADLRQTNQALDERRRYIETLMANLNTAVISVDQYGRVTTANPASHDLLGVSLKVGDDLRSALQEAELQPLKELFEDVIHAAEARQSAQLELSVKGSPLHVAVRISPLIGSRTERLGTLIVVEDLRDVLQAQRAKAWREVARRVAHEIKNPLTPIQLAAQRLEKKFKSNSDDLPRVVPEATGTIVHEVGVLKRLVDEFSRYARLPEIRPQRVEFRPWLETVLNLYQGVPRMGWEVHVGPDLHAAHFDREQMRRVLINLIDNALAAMDGSGKLRIVADRLPDSEGWQLIVEDEGPGIPAKDRARLFEPDFSTKGDEGGLGLAIVQRIVTDHGGSIRVEPRSPKGARFVVVIPGGAEASPSEVSHG